MKTNALKGSFVRGALLGEEGDKAIIFGDDLPVTVLSDVLETIPYEILTSVSGRVKRIYYQD